MASTINNQEDATIQKSDILFGKYKVDAFLGEGSFGKVACCESLVTKEKIAVKIVKKRWEKHYKFEVTMLEKLRRLDRDKNNLVKLIEHFKHRGHACLVFEKLDVSLHDFMVARRFNPLSLSEIRVISKQMLTALEALRSIHLAHTDIKPDNIMLVNHHLHPFKVKLIDFGLAAPVSKIRRSNCIQALGYRAPEVILEIPLVSEAVDMWSLGCVLAFLYLGHNLYPFKCKYEVMRVIVQMHGPPENYLLNMGNRSGDYFTKGKYLWSPWTFHTRSKYMRRTGCISKPSVGIFNRFNSLDDIVQARPEVKDATEHEDTLAFITLLKKILHVNPLKRCRPQQGLKHCFISMNHLSNNNQYVKSARLTNAAAGLDFTAPATRRTKVAAGNDKGQPVKVKATGTNKKPPVKNVDSVKKHNPDGVNNGSGEVTEVKSPRKWLNRICRFFSRMRCCRVGVQIKFK